MRNIGVLYGGSSHHHRTYVDAEFSKYFMKYYYLPGFHLAQLDQIDVLLVPSQLHLKLLEKNKMKIIDFANAGGIVVAFGPQPIQWLPNQRWEFHKASFWRCLNKSAKKGLGKSEYRLFDCIPVDDETWHQHGVFWPPKNIATENGEVAFYFDKTTTKGTFIITTLDPDYHYGSYFMPVIERFLKGFLLWLAFEEI